MQKGFATRALDAYARARKFVIEDRNGKFKELDQKIVELSRFRFNLSPGEKTDGLNEYVKNLISRPLPDPTTPVEPIFEDPPEIGLKRQKLQ